MSHYFSKPYDRRGENMEVKLSLYNYTRKSDLKWATGIVGSNPAEKSDLARLKIQVDKTDIDEL